jgi:hypothetical protein
MTRHDPFQILADSQIAAHQFLQSSYSMLAQHSCSRVFDPRRAGQPGKELDFSCDAVK